MSTIRPWKELSRSQVFSKYGRSIDQVYFELPDGTTSDFYLKHEGRAACILAVTKGNVFVLVRQYRPGPNKVLIELPGGGVDKNEEPFQAAERELLEESGYRGDFSFVTTCFDDAYSSLVRYCYVAQNCVKVAEPQHTSTEHTEVLLKSLDELKALLRSGEMTDIEVGYLGLDFLKLL